MSVSYFFRHDNKNSKNDKSTNYLFRFVQWPEDALLSVSQNFLERVHDLEDNEKLAVSKICVEIHMSVNTMAEK